MAKKGYKDIQIELKLWEDISDYAKTNGLNTNELINRLLRDRFMVEKYGDSPFKEFQKKINMTDPPPEIQQVINDHFWEMLDDKPEKVEPVVKTIEESDKEIVELLSTHTVDENGPVDKELVDKMIEESNEIMDAKFEAPNKPKKRRLK